MAKVTSSNGTEVSGKINDWVYVRYRGGTTCSFHPPLRFNKPTAIEASESGCVEISGPV